jgi:hypothetical protein
LIQYSKKRTKCKDTHAAEPPWFRRPRVPRRSEIFWGGMLLFSFQRL